MYQGHPAKGFFEISVRRGICRLENSAVDSALLTYYSDTEKFAYNKKDTNLIEGKLYGISHCSNWADYLLWNNLQILKFVLITYF